MNNPHLDLEDIKEKWLATCGSCDAGLPMDCTCPDGDYRQVIMALLYEVRFWRSLSEAGQQ